MLSESSPGVLRGLRWILRGSAGVPLHFPRVFQWRAYACDPGGTVAKKEDPSPTTKNLEALAHRLYLREGHKTSEEKNPHSSPGAEMDDGVCGWKSGQESNAMQCQPPQSAMTECGETGGGGKRIGGGGSKTLFWVGVLSYGLFSPPLSLPPPFRSLRNDSKTSDNRTLAFKF